MYLANKLDRIALELQLIVATEGLHADSSQRSRRREVLAKRRLLKPRDRKSPVSQLVLRRYLQFMDSLPLSL